MIVGTGNSPVLTVNLQLASSLRLFFVLKKIDHYAKQFGNLTKSKVASTADNLAIPTPPPGRLSGVADNLQAFAKSLSGSVDEVGETTRLERLKNFAEGNCSFDDVLSDFVDEYVEAENLNKPWSWENNIFNGAQISKGQRAKIKNMAFESGYLPKVTVTPVEGMRFGFADFKGAGLVEEAVDLPKDLWLKSDAEQFKWLDEQIGGSRPGMTWHHTEIPGKMELLPTGIHNIITHNGGRSPGMWGYGPR